ncbi:hypothetical protein, partial [Klebsiella pneumoniae]|uniref:hypothetical protein n=1 Tax=Klebsiella pneumoniae TaxID=573 RepID=UPI001C8F5294
MENDAVTKSYVQSVTLEKTQTGDYNFNQKTITNLGAPTLKDDAVTLDYVKKHSLNMIQNGNFDARGLLVRNVQWPLLLTVMLSIR